MTRYILTFLTFIILLSGCSIEEEIHFNRDFSGNFKRKMNIGQMKTMLQSMKNLGGDSTKQDLDSPLEAPSEMENLMQGGLDKLKLIKGVSGVNLETESEGSFLISFDFEGVEALNKAYNAIANQEIPLDFNLDNTNNSGGGFIQGEVPESEEEAIEAQEENAEDNNKPNFEYFKRKGKYLIFRLPKKERNDRPQGENTDFMKNMGNMISYKFKITFDRKVKKITKKNIEEYLSDDNSVSLNFNLDNIANKDYEMELKIKLR